MDTMTRWILAFFLLTGMARAEVNTEIVLAPKPPRTLEAFGFFEDPSAMRPSKGVVRYDITAPLFSDYAEKDRFIYTPEVLDPDTDGILPFPIGSALIKTFRYGTRKVETRVLIHKDTGWVGYPYLWNEDGTEAKLKLAGANLRLDTSFGMIEYRVPNFNQCGGCHTNAHGKITPIGPRPRHLAKKGQLEHLVQAGVITHVPDVIPTPDYRDNNLPLERRARSYLEANCAHCHAQGLPADTSGLYLNLEEDRPLHLGVHKKPVAAGRGSGGLLVDIDPGRPEKSILYFRMNSLDPGVMMPELGRSTLDQEGLDLIAAYIRSLDPKK